MKHGAWELVQLAKQISTLGKERFAPEMIFRRKMIFCKRNEGGQFLEKECSLSSNCCWRGKTNHEIVSLPLTGDCTDFWMPLTKKVNYSEALENLWSTLVLWMLFLKTKLLASKLVERKQTEKTDAARICIALERERGGE